MSAPLTSGLSVELLLNIVTLLSKENVKKKKKITFYGRIFFISSYFVDSK